MLDNINFMNNLNAKRNIEQVKGYCRPLFFNFFFIIPLKPGIYIGFWGLRVYKYCPFSCETENEAAAAILVLLILINCSYF